MSVPNRLPQTAIGQADGAQAMHRQIRPGSTGDSELDVGRPQMNAQELRDMAPPDKSAPHAAPDAPAGKGHDGHAKAGAQPAMSAAMAHEMGHSGTDLAAM